MRDPKIEELNEDLKIDALKNNIMGLISEFKISPTMSVYILQDILKNAEQVKAQYLDQSAKELRDKLENETESAAQED